MKDFSLLWPAGREAGSPEAGFQLAENAGRDLGLEKTMAALGLGSDRYQDVRQVLFSLCSDPATIRYRQDVIDDLLCHPALIDSLRDLLPEITTLGQYFSRRESPVSREMAGLYQV